MKTYYIYEIFGIILIYLVIKTQISSYLYLRKVNKELISSNKNLKSELNTVLQGNYKISSGKTSQIYFDLNVTFMNVDSQLSSIEHFIFFKSTLVENIEKLKNIKKILENAYSQMKSIKYQETSVQEYVTKLKLEIIDNPSDKDKQKQLDMISSALLIDPYEASTMISHYKRKNKD
jgi:hypothetical protein